ncbi:hypothetical protein EBZ39_12205 [bacterium]|nr:hypothetical protein [bacterium]
MLFLNKRFYSLILTALLLAPSLQAAEESFWQGALGRVTRYSSLKTALVVGGGIAATALGWRAYKARKEKIMLARLRNALTRGTMNGREIIIESTDNDAAALLSNQNTQHRFTYRYPSNTNIYSIEMTPLCFLAAHSLNPDAAVILLNRGANINQHNASGNTPLYEAVSHNNATMVRFLLNRGANPNIPCTNARAEAPLHCAARSNHSEIATLLLEARANPNIQDAAQRTPLELAVTSGHTALSRLLLRKGADPNIRGLYNQTPLHHLAQLQFPFTDMLPILLEGGADINATDSQGEAALHWATCSRNDHLALSLIAEGADINKKDASGTTPVNYATELLLRAQTPAETEE